MVIKEGYKQTDIGLIPNEWEVKRLGEVCQFENGDRSSNYPAANEFVSYGIPFINAGHVSDGIIKLERMDYIPDFVFNRLSGGKVLSGDILFCLRGSLGKFGLVSSDFGKGAIASSLVIIRSKFGTTETYLSCYFKSEICKRMIELYAGGAAQPNLGAKELEKFIIPIPTKAEQTAIATALSDADGLITGLEKLIAKKRNIKQGAMQQLFQPKEGWEVRNLGELIEILADYTANGSFESLKNNVTYYSIRNYAVLVRTTDLDKPVFEPERFTDKRGYDFLSKTSLFGGELILANVGSVGKVFKVPYFNMYMTLAPNTYMIKFFKHISQDFIYQWMQTKEFNTKLLSKIGSTTLLAINKDNLREIIINIPMDLKEQTRIAIILSDMDAELSALEQKLEKYKKVKMGMMQELLTGKTRLV